MLRTGSDDTTAKIAHDLETARDLVNQLANAIADAKGRD